MGKSSSKKDLQNTPHGILHPEKPLEEDGRDTVLRPRSLSEFLGQRAMKENLSVFIEAAKARNENLDHLFLIGPPGLGKTTLAQVVANELGTEFKVTSAPALDKPKDLAGILTTLSEKTVFFIDEIHRLKPAIEEMLYIAMEDYELDWIIGQGPSARTLRIPVQPFTLVGATTRAGLLSAPLRDRFGVISRMEFYTTDELQTIILRSATILQVDITTTGAKEIALRSRGTPRIANRLLRRVRDFAQIKGSGVVDKAIADFSLDALEVDPAGLDRLDRLFLDTLILKYNGGPVGLETIAASISEDAATLEDMVEPFLMQQGLIQRTPRGRMVTDYARSYLGYKTAETSEQQIRLDKG